MSHLSRSRQPVALRRFMLVACSMVGAFSSMGLAATDDAGREAFLAQKCNRCHSIATQKIEATVKSETMRGPDLSTIGKEHDADWIKQYVLKEVKLKDKDHKAKWEGSSEDLQRIADWLASLK